MCWVVFVGQLIEQSLPTPKVRGLNPVICKRYFTYTLSTVLKRQKMKKKEAGKDPFTKGKCVLKAVLLGR